MTTNIIDFLHTTAAYQTAIVQLLTTEVNKLADKLDLAGSRPLMVVEADAGLSPLGVAGSIVTTDYGFTFSEGRLATFQKPLWLAKATRSTNIHELADKTSLISSNGAYQLATQTLAL